MHVVTGNIRGKDVKATVVPHDVGGYAILDIVFGETFSAKLVLKPYEIEDEKIKKTVKGNTYSVKSVDETTGEIYKCPVKPFRNSDKNILTMLVG